MSKLIEFAAMALGGLSLFTVCFLGFTVFTGVPLQDVALVGRFFEPPPLPRMHDQASARSTPPTDSEVIEASMGIIGAWTLESPFEEEELQHLVDELKARGFELDQRLAEVQERERRIADREGSLDERIQGLADVRTELDVFEEALRLRDAEVRSAEQSLQLRQEAKWADFAPLFASMEPREASQRLLDFDPAEAAQILTAMDETSAADVLNALPPEHWKAFAEAYAQARAGGDRRRP